MYENKNLKLLFGSARSARFCQLAYREKLITERFRGYLIWLAFKLQAVR